MRILGIDIGSLKCGYAIIDINNIAILVDAGEIRVSNNVEYSLRLYEIQQIIEIIIDSYNPDLISIEEPVLRKNISLKAVFSVAQSQAAVLLSAVKLGIAVKKLYPTQIKKIIAGNAKADKEELAEIVINLFELDYSWIKYTDMTDAISIALSAYDV